MEKILQNIINVLEKKISAANNECQQDGIPQLEPIEIKLLGQFGLLVQEQIADQLSLNRTQDVDAILKSDIRGKRLFTDALQEFGLVYDELSSEIWIPKNSEYKKIYEGARLTIWVLDYFSILVSKAVKAPEKNKQLLAAAIALLGKPLIDLMIKNGTDIEYFIK